MKSNDSKSLAPVKGAWWTLGVLTLVAILDWADRALIAAAVEPIKDEFELTDGQIGLLMGFAFVAIRVLMGLPIGLLADRFNRRNITAVSIVVWSLGTAAFGLARNFTGLVAGRLVIGAGTAGAVSPSLSMIADMFPLKRRGLAMGIWNAGATAGYSLGIAIGALSTQMYGWRFTMIAFGVVGILVAVFVVFGVREPERRDSAGNRESTPIRTSAGEVLRFMFSQRSMVHVCIGFAVAMAIDMMASFWVMTFFVRSHGLTLAEAGGMVSIMWLASIPGSLIFGYLADRLGRRDVRWHGWLVALACLFTAATTAGIYLAEAAAVAFVFLAVNSFIFSFTYPAATFIAIGLFPVRMRAFGYALFTITFYAGYAFGPAYIGIVSDWMEPQFGSESLRYAMLLSIPFMFWAALHLWLAAEYLERDYERANKAADELVN